jgi:chemotaxis protein histidine kinase CheA
LFAQQHRDAPAELHESLERARAEGTAEAYEAALNVVHRLHGTARMLGLNALGLFAGAIERSLLALSRRASRVEPDAWQVLLASADELDRLMQELVERDVEGCPSSALKAALDDLASR